MLVCKSFNPRTYIRYDVFLALRLVALFGFNPRTYIRYDVAIIGPATSAGGFNPRTYIRYDRSMSEGVTDRPVSIHVPI